MSSSSSPHILSTIALSYFLMNNFFKGRVKLMSLGSRFLQSSTYVRYSELEGVECSSVIVCLAYSRVENVWKTLLRLRDKWDLSDFPDRTDFIETIDLLSSSHYYCLFDVSIIYWHSFRFLRLFLYAETFPMFRFFLSTVSSRCTI